MNARDFVTDSAVRKLTIMSYNTVLRNKPRLQFNSVFNVHIQSKLL